MAAKAQLSLGGQARPPAARPLAARRLHKQKETENGCPPLLLGVTWPAASANPRPREFLSGGALVCMCDPNVLYEKVYKWLY